MAAKTYFSCFIRFMEFLDKTKYDKNHQFEEEKLLSIKPQDICRYFKLMAYGTENPSDHETPTKMRSHTLHYHKKAISYYMPRKNIRWDDAGESGNPTQSIAVNNLIKLVKKHEARKQGAKSRAVRLLEDDEFVSEQNSIVMDPTSYSTLLNEVRGIQSSVMDLKRRMDDNHVSLANDVNNQLSSMRKQLRLMDASIKRIAMQPVVRDDNTAPTLSLSTCTTRPAKLSKGPRDLFELWREYQFGQDNNKPARLFTSRERGQVRSTYSFRKKFWDRVNLLIREGRTSEVAIDEIYAKYGREKSPIQILRHFQGRETVKYNIFTITQTNAWI